MGCSDVGIEELRAAQLIGHALTLRDQDGVFIENSGRGHRHSGQVLHFNNFANLSNFRLV